MGMLDPQGRSPGPKRRDYMIGDSVMTDVVFTGAGEETVHRLGALKSEPI